jgi:hypothetical protein
MNAFIFVAIVCVGGQCDFTASNNPMTFQSCQEMKKEFLGLRFKPNTTLAAAQCMQFDGPVNNKVKV